MLGSYGWSSLRVRLPLLFLLGIVLAGLVAALISIRFFQGYTHEQIAKALDMPLGTVKTRIRSALTQLRSLLQ